MVEKLGLLMSIAGVVEVAPVLGDIAEAGLGDGVAAGRLGSIALDIGEYS